MTAATRTRRVFDVLLPSAELGIIVWAWYGFIGARWQNGALPMGQEYPRNTHSLFFWENLVQCGQCAYWADVMGGYPVFADVFGSFYHPLAMVMTLLYGAVTGSALTVAASFLVIALAAWWLGLLVQLHPLSRLWYALLAMIGGHMGSRLGLGSIGMPLATAAAWWAIVALIALVLRPAFWRATVAGMALGMLWCAGQGYFQLGVGLALPLFGVYTWYYRWWDRNAGAKVLLCIWSGLLSVLIAAPLIINIVRYNGLFSKDYDLEFSYAQPIERALINMMVGRFDIAKGTALNAFAFPWAYSIYIGLFTVLLGVLALVVVRDTRHRPFVYLLSACSALWLFVASGTPQRMVAALGNEDLTKAVSSLRFLVLLDGLAALAIATMAAFALHAILVGSVLPGALQRVRRWMSRRLRVDVVTIVAAYLCVVNLSDVRDFVNNWVYDAPPFTEQQLRIAQAAASVNGATVDSGVDWMHMPLLAEHVNVTNLHMAWQIDGKEFPRAEYEIRQDVPAGMRVIEAFADEWKFVQSDDLNTRYAVVYGEDNQLYPCTNDATRGGVITVACSAPVPGVLRVFEHNLAGWEVTQSENTRPVRRDNDWLTADVAAGSQQVTFRYAPWSAVIGVALSIFGWVLVLAAAVVCLVRAVPGRRPVDATRAVR